MDDAHSHLEDEKHDVFLDPSHTKLEDETRRNQVLRNINFDEEIAALDAEGAKFLGERTFWQRLRSLDLGLALENRNHMVYVLGGFACMAGILSGVDQSLISGADYGMTAMLGLSSHQESLVSSLMPLGAVAGSIIMTPLNYYFGRKGSILISCLWYTAGAILCAAAQNFHVLVTGRFMLGIGIGIEGGCVGIYVSESVPSTVRGNLVSLYQFNIALGELFGYIIGVIFFDVYGGWRFMLGSSLVFSTILMCGMLFLPESPRWLVHKGRIGEAWNVYKRLRDISVDENKLEFLEARHVAIQEKEYQSRENKVQKLLDLVRIPRNRRALIHANMMIALGQLTGINAIMYYMSTLMHKIGFDEKQSVAMSMVGGAALLIGTIPAILFMDRYGRRTWAHTIWLFIFGLVLVGVGYRINVNTHKAAAEGVYLTGQILYNMSFGSYAALTWVVPSESFSLSTRSLGMTICSAMLYLWAFIVTYNFDRMQAAFTYTGLTLGFYGGIAVVIGIPYQMLFMPETRNKTLEQIDDIFSQTFGDIARQNIANMRNTFNSIFGK